MNAHALLTAQGWRGTGHSLHPTSDDTGLTHHILIKRNQDGSGLGSKKDHKQEAWWLNAFDQALKGIDTKSGTMKQTLVGGALEKITARNAATKYTGIRGLYTSFVRGGILTGSMHEPAKSSLPTPPDSGTGTPLVASESEEKKKKKQKGKKKKSKSTSTSKREEAKGETKEERRARREARRVRRAEKEAKRLKKAQREAQREAQRRTAKKIEKKKAEKAEKQAIKEKRKATETKEERRARRDARRKRKEKKRLARATKG